MFSFLFFLQVSNFNLYLLGKKLGLQGYLISEKFEPVENWLPPCYVLEDEKPIEGKLFMAVAQFLSCTSYAFCVLTVKRCYEFCNNAQKYARSLKIEKQVIRLQIRLVQHTNLQRDAVSMHV